MTGSFGRQALTTASGYDGNESLNVSAGGTGYSSTPIASSVCDLANVASLAGLRPKALVRCVASRTTTWVAVVVSERLRRRRPVAGRGRPTCTASELSVDEAGGTGCGYDSKRVWSARRLAVLPASTSARRATRGYWAAYQRSAPTTRIRRMSGAVRTRAPPARAYDECLAEVDEAANR